MDQETDHLDQADEDILTYTVSDEALEAAAGTESEAVSSMCYGLGRCSWRGGA